MKRLSSIQSTPDNPKTGKRTLLVVLGVLLVFIGVASTFIKGYFKHTDKVPETEEAVTDVHSVLDWLDAFLDKDFKKADDLHQGYFKLLGLDGNDEYPDYIRDSVESLVLEKLVDSIQDVKVDQFDDGSIKTYSVSMTLKTTVFGEYSLDDESLLKSLDSYILGEISQTELRDILSDSILTSIAGSFKDSELKDVTLQLGEAHDLTSMYYISDFVEQLLSHSGILGVLEEYEKLHKTTLRHILANI